MNRIRLLLASIALGWGVTACQSVALGPSAAQRDAIPSVSVQRMVATVRAAAGSGEGELAVQPLREGAVEDLRQRAHALETQQRYTDAADALDQALSILPDDPAVLQERAEAALLLRDFPTAERLARRAFELGSQVGPLCRRHWATVRQTRFAANDGVGAKQAQAALDACRLAPPARY